MLSHNSINKKGYVQKELKMALEELSEYPEHETYIIPVRINDCEPSANEIYELNWIDMFPAWEEGLEKIEKSINVECLHVPTKTSDKPLLCHGLAKTLGRSVPIVSDYFVQLSKRIIEPDNREVDAPSNPRRFLSSSITSTDANQLMHELTSYAHRVQPDYILGVNRGGTMAGAFISLSLGVPSSRFCRVSCIGNKRIELTADNLKGTILVIDDVSRTGETISKVVEHVKTIEGVEKVLSAVLVSCVNNENTNRSDINHCVSLSENRDIVLPWTPPRESQLDKSEKKLTDLAVEMYSQIK